MKPIITLLFLFLFQLPLYSSILLNDYNQELDIPVIFETTKKDKEEISSPKNFFHFNIGKIEGDISLFGTWKLRLGFGTGFMLNPELIWLLNIAGLKQGVIFEQQRVFSLDWITNSGIYLHLFFNDDIDATEFTFRYEIGKIFNAVYVTNKLEKTPINPFRNLESGRAQDILMGFDWKTRYYRGRFDIKFDSVKLTTDRFKGNKKLIQNKLAASQYERGIFYYLPDEQITGNLVIYASDDQGLHFSDIPASLSAHRKFIRLREEIDYQLDYKNGLVTFTNSVHGKTVLIYYQTRINGAVYEVGESATQFPRTSGTNSRYFVNHSGKYYLILSFHNKYSRFEEKNAYKITSPNRNVSQLVVDILDQSNNRLADYSAHYDQQSGCIKVSKNSKKGDTYHIYPFYDEVDSTVFYLSYHSPRQSISKNVIDFSCYMSGEGLKLSQKPIPATLVVYLNSVPLEKGKYSYDFITHSLYLNFEVNDNDNIEVSYLTEDRQNFQTTFSFKNDFKPNPYLLIGDSLWYKMPVKLWESSYYFRMHSAELLYNMYLKGDFKKFIVSQESGQFGFTSNATLSLFIPDLKGKTLIEDFEYEPTGYNLDLNYKYWYPVTINPEVAAAGYGRLYYRNMHQNQILNNNLISIYDNTPPPASYKKGSTIGPYSSNDGISYHFQNQKFTANKKSVSLISEIELQSNQAVSIAIPITDKELDFSHFVGLTALIKTIELTDKVRLYIDAGEVSEQFISGKTSVQKETFDEGLKYNVNGGYYMLKGKGDGTNSSNDFNEDGILSSDDPGMISGLSYQNNDYVEIKKKFLEVVDFKIKNPERLKTIRAVRLTFFNPHAYKVRGKIMFNQLRFVETGWEFDSSGNSYADEIFPAEDGLLLKNIFSIKNPEIDKQLHFQRLRERTMRIKLSQYDSFYVKKNFGNAIDMNHFNEICFFIFLEYPTSRRLKVSLIDTAGRKLETRINLSGYSANKWHQIKIPLHQFRYYSESNRLIYTIQFDFLNEQSDQQDNKIFIDEIFLDKIQPAVGFSTSNELIYSDPKLKLTVNGLSIFDSPYLKLKNTFNTINFLERELIPNKDYTLANDLIHSFNLFTISHFISSKTNFILKKDSLIHNKENLQLKIYRDSTVKLPLLFTLFYDYAKSGQGNLIDQNRNLLLEVGNRYQNLFFKFGYKINNYNKLKSNVSSQYFTDFSFSVADVNVKLNYSIANYILREIRFGYFSLDNLAYLLRDDFLLIYYEGNQKKQKLAFSAYAYLLPFLFYSFDFNLSYSGQKIGLQKEYLFQTDLKSKHLLDFIGTYKNRKNSLVQIEYSRSLKNKFNRLLDQLNWDYYFHQTQYAYQQNAALFLYPPFSSLYQDQKSRLFIHHYFQNLTDRLGLTLDWSLFIANFIFMPKNFIFIFDEKIINNNQYIVDYYLTFILNANAEYSSFYFKKVLIDYQLSQKLGFREFETTSTTAHKFSLFFYLFNNIDLEAVFQYSNHYIHSQIKQELQHTIDILFSFYKSFFQRNYILNDKYGVETGFKLKNKTLLIQRFDQTRADIIDKPFNASLEPMLGYRFNRNLTLRSYLTLAYSLEVSRLYATATHNFGLQFILEGVLTF